MSRRITSSEIVPTGWIFPLISLRIGSRNHRSQLLFSAFLAIALCRWTGTISHEADFFAAGGLLA